ncbi:unnamed protein product [Auanema sp. JU1783]|nr:unnamed protein product [Auanema sp. JU1783]
MIVEEAESTEGPTTSVVENPPTETVTGSRDPTETQSSVPEEDVDENLMCRVCRSSEGSLYYPCLCTGSIKYVHQECLTEWLKYSKKEVCELCNYKYSFQAIYRPDMPKALPLKDIVKGVAVNVARFLKTWIVYSIVILAWFGIVPLTAARIYNAVFYASVYDMFSKPGSFLRTDAIAGDILKGVLLLFLFICIFISLVWLREQIIHGGPQDFLNIPVEVEPDDGLLANNNDDNERNNEVIDPDPPFDVDGAFPEINFDEQNNPANESNDGEDNEFEDTDDENDGQENVEAEQPQQEENWRDWDRLGDELTWQRLLGLDGSFVFIEHVFWVISLNTLFTVLFAYAPYRIGHAALYYFGIQQNIHYFPSLVAILCGYFLIACCLYILHGFAGLLKLKVLYRMLGISFLILKVFLLVLIELGMFPIICGCWLDLCSLSLFSSTLTSRLVTFSASPVSAVFIHWMIGMIYVFYSASYAVLLREILRPGVLWFLRNLNDPEFNPIQEMIELPVTSHVRRLILSTSIFFSTIFLIVYVPLRCVRRFAPNCLPFNMSVTADTPLSELSLELLILQVVLPALLEQSQARVILKTAVKVWCQYVGRLLGLETYLLPEHELVAPEVPPVEQQNGPLPIGLGAEHQALLFLREPQNNQAQTFMKPAWFPLRICGLLLCMAGTTVLLSSAFFFLPVTIGRFLMHTLAGLSKVHDLYTVGSGLYICWLIVRVLYFLYEWCNQGMVQIKQVIVNYALLVFRLSIISIPTLVLIPMLMGTYFQLVLVTPVRLDHNQSSLYFHWQDWAMGVLHLKIVCAVIMMGPDWWLKLAFEQIYQDGILDLNASRILFIVILPVSLALGSLISVPFLLARTYIYLIGSDILESVLIYRLSYPCSLVILLTCAFFRWQYLKFKGLAEFIRNEKYLVGTQLVNYERDTNTSQSQNVTA